MKILVLSPLFPFPPGDGGKVRVYNLIKQIAVGNQITLIAFGRSEEKSEDVKNLKNYCQKIKVIPRSSFSLSFLSRIKRLFYHFFTLTPLVIYYQKNREMERTIEEEIKNNCYDCILIESIWMSRYGLKIKNIPKILDEFDLASSLYNINLSKKNIFRYLLGQLDRFKFKLYEKNTCQKFDQIWVTSPEDLNKFTQWVPAGKIKVVPNGVDLNFFQGKSGEEGKKRLIFLGLMSYFPNIEAVLFFTNEIFPLIKRKIPEIDFFIIGPGLDDEKGKQLKSEGIKIIGPVKDVRKFLSPSSIMVVPLKKGGGTRLKILESFALECPVVSTSIGCEGLAVQHNKHLLIADTPTEFAQAVVRLVKNEKLRHQITREAKKLVEIQYSWSLIGERARRELTLLKRSLQWINS